MDQANLNFIILFLLTLNTICVILGVVYLVRQAIDLKAKELSTHKFEYIPFDPKWAESEEKLKELNEELFDSQDELFPDPEIAKKML